MYARFFLVWSIANTFDLKFIENPTWIQFIGLHLLFSMFVFPFVYDKVSKEDDDKWDGFLTQQTTIILSYILIYVVILIFK